MMLRRGGGTQQQLLRSFFILHRPLNSPAKPQLAPQSVSLRPCVSVQSSAVVALAPSSLRFRCALSHCCLACPHRQSATLAAHPTSSSTASLALKFAAATVSAAAPAALHSPIARYCTHGTHGGVHSTRVCLGSGALRHSQQTSADSGSSVTGGMEAGNEAPARPRRGRPPGKSAAKAARKAARPAVKRAAAASTSKEGPRRRPRGTAASSATPSSAPSKRAAAADVAADADTPQSNKDAHAPSHSKKPGLGNARRDYDDDDGDAAQDAEVYSGQYELSHDAMCAQTSARLDFPLYAVRFVLSQAKEGATVPFLARYRQGETGRMDETQLRHVLDTAKEVKEVHRRRQFMLRSLEGRGLLTPALRAALEAMVHVSQLEDAWEPYKERRTSLASRGRAEGLGKYASALLHFSANVAVSTALLSDLRAAVSRVEDGERLLIAIVAEDVQRSEVLRRRLGEYCRRTTRITSTMVSKPRKKVAKDMQEENFEHLKKHFAFYDGKSWSVDRIAAHVVLALQRGEAKGVLQVEATSGPKSHGLFMHTAREEFPDVARFLPSPDASSTTHRSVDVRDAGYCRNILQAGLQSAYDYVLKQLSTAVRRDLKKSAEQEAIIVFAHNLHHMLLQRPLAHSRVLAMDPGHTHGVKCVALDEHGGVETFFTCTLMDEAKMRQYVTQVVESRRLNKIVIGNGTASAETSELVADLIKSRSWQDVEFAVVSEAGASVYSVSDIAKEEFPTLGVMYRGAVSIGRRVLDPLSELVKIPVRSMGIGMYQHDVNEKELMRELGYVLESCVAKVGINAVSANRYVMEKVPGIQKRIVDQIVLARHAKKLHSREDLRRVPAMTESVYEQIAGFFRFPNSPEPLDNTNIHPESYPLVRRLVRLHVAGQLNTTAPAVPIAGGANGEEEGAVGDAQTRQAVARALQQLSPAQLATLASQRLACTVETLELVMQELLHPGLDPRASLPHAGLLRREVHDVRDLRTGEVLSGVVQSVTMFGAFVDCGLHDSVLVRGNGVDTLQVGAYLNKRIRFDSLDHLKRPRMVLLPDPNEVNGRSRGGGSAGLTRRLRLESDDLLGSEGVGLSAPDVRHGTAGHPEDAGAASAAALAITPQSLSATILRERKRRADEEHGTGNGSNIPSASVALPPLSIAGQPASGEVGRAALQPTAPTQSGDIDGASRPQKRQRSPSPEFGFNHPHLNVQQQQSKPRQRVSEHAAVAPLAAASRGRGTPRGVLRMSAASTGALSVDVKEHSTIANVSKTAKTATGQRETIDADAESLDSPSSSSGSDLVFSF